MAAVVLQENSSRSSTKLSKSSLQNQRRARVGHGSGSEAKEPSNWSGSSNLAVIKVEDGVKEDYPLIFKCTECDAIFGDSLSWIREDETMKTITLSRAERKVKIGDQFHYSAEGTDAGCCYVKLQCANCDIDVGRMYRATTRLMDDLRDVFTFDVSRIDSYEIGGANSHKVGGHGSNGDVCNVGRSVVPAVVCDQSISSNQQFFSHISKMQNLMMMVSERLLSIENTISANTVQPGSREFQDISNSQSRVLNQENINNSQDGSDSDVIASNRKRGKLS